MTKKTRGEEEIRTLGMIKSYIGLAIRRFRPLSHLSNYIHCINYNKFILKISRILIYLDLSKSFFIYGLGGA